MPSIGPPSALSPYFALKSATAMFTASTAFLPDRSAYTPDWSLITPMTTLPSVSFTAVAAVPPVVPPAQAVATSRPANGSASHRGMRMDPPPYPMSLDAEMLSELGLPGPHFVVAERRDDRAVAQQIMAGSHRPPEAEVLTHHTRRPAPHL